MALAQARFLDPTAAAPAPAAPPGGGGAPPAAGQPAAEVTVSKAAKSDLSTREWARYVGISLLIAAVTYVISLFLILPDCATSEVECTIEDTYHVSSDLSLFAGLFVLALAVERALELFSRFIGTNTAEKKDERDEKNAELKTAVSGAGTAAAAAAPLVQAAAKASADVDKSREITSILHWGVAAGVSFVLASKLNILLLTAIGDPASALPTPWADLLVTGLVVGAGTKPLHDLVSKLEKSKEAEKDPR